MNNQLEPLAEVEVALGGESARDSTGRISVAMGNLLPRAGSSEESPQSRSSSVALRSKGVVAEEGFSVVSVLVLELQQAVAFS